jgi:transcriptional regulator with GAF, ATPase, and Fis domain
MSLLSDVADWMQIVGVPLALGALVAGLLQLKQADKQLDKAGETARVQVLLALDESLSRFEDIRAKLNTKQLNIKDKDEKVGLRRYIGAFERIGYALKVEETTLELVNQFYGSRFKVLVEYIDKNDDAKGIFRDEEGWKDFFYLWRKLLPLRGLPQPLPELSR